MSGELLLRVEDLAVHFPVTAGVFGRQTASVKAVDGISFEIHRGGTLGLVGESGCGKSTAGRAILRLLDPTRGRVEFDGRDITALPQSELRELRREMQIIFQDPFASLNPRMTVMDIVGESLLVHGIASGAELEARVLDLLSRVGLPKAWSNRYPHEFSGGQRQRISVARAIALEPKLVVCDEAVSALDVSIQAQVINLLIELRREMDLAYLFISHDLAVVRHISDEVAVMYLGQIVERAPTAQLFRNPVHPYTRALLSAIPVPDPQVHHQRILLRGDVPSPLNPPAGCRFHTRCPAVMDRCRSETPPAVALDGGQIVSCFLAGEASPGDAYARMLERNAARNTQPAPRSATPVATLQGDAPAVRVIAEPADPRTPLEFAALALACGLLLFGAPVTGVLLGGAACVGLFVANTGRARGIALVAALALVGCFAVGNFFAARGLVARAEWQLLELSAAIEAVATDTGRYPASLRDLGWRLPTIVGDTNPLDPWGRPWQYATVSETGFALGSFGPDGQAGGGDDIGELVIRGADS